MKIKDAVITKVYYLNPQHKKMYRYEARTKEGQYIGSSSRRNELSEMIKNFIPKAVESSSTTRGAGTTSTSNT